MPELCACRGVSWRWMDAAVGDAATLTGADSPIPRCCTIQPKAAPAHRPMNKPRRYEPLDEPGNAAGIASASATSFVRADANVTNARNAGGGGDHCFAAHRSTHDTCSTMLKITLTSAH